MPPVGFELTISAGEQPQTYASDRAAAGTGSEYIGLQIKEVLSQIPGYTAQLIIFKQLLPQT